MKLLLDENLSRRLLPELEAAFPGSSQAALLSLERAQDIEIWRFAKEGNFAIVTKDADFVELSLMHGSPPKVVWLNLGNVPNSAVRQALPVHAQDIHGFADSSEGVLEIE